MKISEEYDAIECRCRMLGHPVPFSYCRTVKDGFPCFKVLDCWFEIVPVREYIGSNYSEDEIGEFLAPPRPKILTLVELIEKAKKSGA